MLNEKIFIIGKSIILIRLEIHFIEDVFIKIGFWALCIFLIKIKKI
jgi:hypothetical protein